MKILVLGATGQIGRALTQALLQAGHQVTVLVRSAAGHPFPRAVAVIERKAFTPEIFKSAMRDVEHVIYGIGLPEQFTFDNSIFQRVNCDLLRSFLDAFRSSGLRQLTYISTYEVFEEIDGAIDETHPVADESHMTPYFQSMVRAYRIAVDFAQANELTFTSIHPAAVYGGINTGGGITDYMGNLASWNWYRVPFINAGSFPVVHVDSLSDAIVRSLDSPGAYIASDHVTSLKEIAQTMRAQTRSYVPVILPLGLIKTGISLLEAVARTIKVKPFASAVQIDFLTKGWKPSPDKAIRELGWKPMPLQEGVRRFLAARRSSYGVDRRLLGGAYAMTAMVAMLELATAAGLLLYWLLFFTVGLAPDDPPPGYFVFQRSFTISDVILALALTRAGSHLLAEDGARRIVGRRQSLVCAGALLFLGGLDVSFNFQNGIYDTLSIDVVLEMAINLWCAGFGLLLVFMFATDPLRRD